MRGWWSLSFAHERRADPLSKESAATLSGKVIDMKKSALGTQRALLYYRLSVNAEARRNTMPLHSNLQQNDYGVILPCTCTVMSRTVCVLSSRTGRNESIVRSRRFRLMHALLARMPLCEALQPLLHPRLDMCTLEHQWPQTRGPVFRPRPPPRCICALFCEVRA
ncbi:hypothetical protein EXIGLDRAFT_417608 [Exidia glandulosa HHB12029]|uniref:Uncharacterized protein n=1 Tax=Exidia glandulosa HHB12029 TaxID=1314781 RepID=A0A165PT80_EXIGL|nr:hypothetical protein EXIGLDRAFT_417608 [Exidia glandulosa HHB12029]